MQHSIWWNGPTWLSNQPNMYGESNSWKKIAEDHLDHNVYMKQNSWQDD